MDKVAPQMGFMAIFGKIAEWSKNDQMRTVWSKNCPYQVCIYTQNGKVQSARLFSCVFWDVFAFVGAVLFLFISRCRCTILVLHLECNGRTAVVGIVILVVDIVFSVSSCVPRCFHFLVNVQLNVLLLPASTVDPSIFHDLTVFPKSFHDVFVLFFLRKRAVSVVVPHCLFTLHPGQKFCSEFKVAELDSNHRVNFVHSSFNQC